MHTYGILKIQSTFICIWSHKFIEISCTLVGNIWSLMFIFSLLSDVTNHSEWKKKISLVPLIQVWRWTVSWDNAYDRQARERVCRSLWVLDITTAVFIAPFTPNLVPHCQSRVVSLTTYGRDIKTQMFNHFVSPMPGINLTVMRW